MRLDAGSVIGPNEAVAMIEAQTAKLTPCWRLHHQGETEYMTVQATLVLATGERSIHDVRVGNMRHSPCPYPLACNLYRCLVGFGSDYEPTLNAILLPHQASYYIAITAAQKAWSVSLLGAKS